MARLLCAMALAAVVTAVPALAADGNAAAPAGPQDRSALAQAGEVTGILKKVNPTDKTFTLEVDVAELRGRLRLKTTAEHAARLAQQGVRQAARAGQEEARLLEQEEKALQTRSPVKRAEKLDRVAVRAEKLQAKERAQQEKLRLEQEAQKVRQALAPGAHAHVQAARFDLGSGHDVKVRRLEPPVRYTKKGKVKKYTAKELKELKGADDDLVGYRARFTDLRPGQIVQVGLTPPKAADKKGPSARPVAGLIVILADVPDPNPPAANAKIK